MRFLRIAALQGGNFVAWFHFYIVIFITSAYLAKFVGVEYVGYAFVGSSVLVALLLYAAPTIFRTFGTRNVITVVGITEVMVLLALALVTDAWSAVLLVTAQTALAYTLFVGIDLLIEASIPSEGSTGSHRTTFLILGNAAAVIASLSISILVVGDQYQNAFIASAFILIVFLIYAFFFFPSISFPETSKPQVSLFRRLRSNKSLAPISFAHLMLQIFFSWMGIYVPILLFIYEGFAWSEIGILLSLAMIPYVVLEYPLGFIADKWLGEKEILTAGFGIMAASLLGMTLLHGASLGWWIAIMIFSRCGAAAVEAMTEVHFFRHVSEKDTGIITIFRELRPIGSIIGPIAASLTLMWFSLPIAFTVFAVLMLAGIPIALSIKDSK